MGGNKQLSPRRADYGATAKLNKSITAAIVETIVEDDSCADAHIPLFRTRMKSILPESSPLQLRLQSDSVVYCAPEPLLAAQVSFGCFH